MRLDLFANIDTDLNSVERNSSTISSFGKKCLIITGKSSAKLCGALDDVLLILKRTQTDYVIFDKVSSNPTVDICFEASRFGRNNNADFVIGIGGGSVLDAAKATSLFLANSDLDEKSYYDMQWNEDAVPLVLVGTTAGTGSEVTSVCVLIDSTGKKHSLHHRVFDASLSLGDAKYTQSQPKDITISTGIDALSHCVESYFTKKANEVSRAFSVRGISLLYSSLITAYSSDNIDISVRQNLYDGSILGGLAIRITGTGFPHSMGYYLTEKFNIPHGIASTEYLVDLLNYVESVNKEYSTQFYNEIGISKNDFISTIEQIRPKVHYDISKDDIEENISRWENNSVRNTLGNVTLDDIRMFFFNK